MLDKVGKNQTDNALWKHFSINAQAEQTDASSPVDAKLAVILNLLQHMDERTRTLWSSFFESFAEPPPPQGDAQSRSRRSTWRCDDSPLGAGR